MKKALCIFVVLISCIFSTFSKQYFKYIKGKSNFTLEDASEKVTDSLLAEMQELINNGYHIDNIITTDVKGYTVGYTIIYSDEK